MHNVNEEIKIEVPLHLFTAIVNYLGSDNAKGSGSRRIRDDLFKLLKGTKIDPNIYLIGRK